MVKDSISTGVKPNVLRAIYKKLIQQQLPRIIQIMEIVD